MQLTQPINKLANRNNRVIEQYINECNKALKSIRVCQIYSFGGTRKIWD